ncbi:SH3 domain-containing protein [Tenacibaculum agarivorans]|uniref:SH3 domain-containing protein n=1 Tax=Tenacibaculum agarivorans TaxID=1908389 RepID=UPI00094BAC2A|nr:SH3 domain-containing protein [Tenacibaculum agarivorans]
MRGYFSILFILFTTYFGFSQSTSQKEHTIIESIDPSEESYYYVTAKNGLNVRKNPRLSSTKKTKLPFGLLVEKIANTNAKLTVKERNKEVHGKWVKIKYNNYTYLISDRKDTYEEEGYVFDGYLKNLYHDNVLNIQKIEREKYTTLLKKAHKETPKLVKIGTLDAVKTTLRNRIDWVTEFKDSTYAREDVIKSITLHNGKKLLVNNLSDEIGFAEGWSGYYPEFDILLLEGGHASDVSFNIRTGETTLTTGNPEYIVYSPKKKYRLNGYHSGQECISFFLQIRKGNTYEYVTKFNDNLELCTYEEFFWINDQEFIYQIKNYTNDSIHGIKEYYIGKIKL